MESQLIKTKMEQEKLENILYSRRSGVGELEMQKREREARNPNRAVFKTKKGYVVRVINKETKHRFILGVYETKEEASKKLSYYKRKGFEKYLMKEGKKYKLHKEGGHFVFNKKIVDSKYLLTKLNENGEPSFIKRVVEYHEIKF